MNSFWSVIVLVSWTLSRTAWGFQTTPWVSPAVASSRRSSRSIVQAAQTGDEFRGGPGGPNGPGGGGPRPPMDPRQAQAAYEENRVRQAYADWCRNYGKDFQEERLPIFADNLLRMEKYAEQTGERVRFNEYADLTTDEYRTLLIQQQQQQRRGGATSSYSSSSSSSSSSLQSPPDWQQAAPTRWQRGLQDINPKGYETLMGLWVYFQTAFVGTVIGTLCVLPVTALHYLVFQDYSYTTYAQWEWDLIAAAVQAGVFATTFRYAVRRDDFDNEKLIWRIIAAFVFVKSLVRITVMPDCAAYTWLYCAEPFYLVNEEMASTLLLNFAESLALFVPVAKVLQSLLRSGKIPPYDGYDA